MQARVFTLQLGVWRQTTCLRLEPDTEYEHWDLSYESFLNVAIVTWFPGVFL